MDDYRDLTALLDGTGVRYVRNFRNVAVSGVEADSRRVRPGNLFVAVPGARVDGHTYALSALDRGAAALVVEREDFPGREAAARLPVAVVSDARAAVARLASAWHGHPSRRLTVVGVTGTNGKTTITYLLRSILEVAGAPVGLLGTTGYFLGAEALDAPTTTPGPVDLQSMLARMVAGGVTHAVMEVSSHALDQKRAASTEMDAAVFSNLRSDHMDYHETPADYLKAKGALFSLVRPGGPVVLNADDWASVVYATRTRGRVQYYSRRGRADLRVEVRRSGLWGSETLFHWRGRTVPVTVHMPGLHNVENAAAAALCALSLGVAVPDVCRGIAACRSVPGRLEPVPSDLPFDVFVDYAHTDDALSAVLQNLDARKRGRLIAVFGCGGDRDTFKRPRMARVAESLADFTVVTSDNPRTEDPMDIIRDVVAGFQSRASYLVNPDRAAAIETAVSMARAGDIVVIAGKGHETYQEIQGERFHFDDGEVAQAALAVVGERGPDRPDGTWAWLKGGT